MTTGRSAAVNTYGSVRERPATRAQPASEQTVSDHVCDRGDCPAPAARELTLVGQDFYFCNHHAAELERTLPPAAEPAAPSEEAVREPAPVP
jgi:hypothetical protein